MNIDTRRGVTSVLSKSLRTESLRVLLLPRIVLRMIEICRMCIGGVVEFVWSGFGSGVCQSPELEFRMMIHPRQVFTARMMNDKWMIFE
jgi:hypothetical protein